MTPFTLTDFLAESNRIEGMERAVTEVERLETALFLRCEKVTIPALRQLVTTYQPNAQLRDRFGLDVYVGAHVPPIGGPQIVTDLAQILARVNARDITPWAAHCQYETLHPFTDGNGRSGRALWLWAMGGINKAPLGFLHTFYYQTLQETRQ